MKKRPQRLLAMAIALPTTSWRAKARHPRLAMRDSECRGNGLRYRVPRGKSWVAGLRPPRRGTLGLARSWRAPLACLLPALLLLSGCDYMDKQHKAKAWSSESHEVRSADGTVAWREKSAPPPPLTLALLQRGQDRFRIYCTPCHSELGDGNGMVVQRGFPHPPSYHEQRLVQAPTQHFYDVITHGHGAMYSFAARVAPDDRWAIAAYIRALQLSQHAAPDDLSPAERQALK